MKTALSPGTYLNLQESRQKYTIGTYHCALDHGSSPQGRVESQYGWVLGVAIIKQDHRTHQLNRRPTRIYIS